MPVVKCHHSISVMWPGYGGSDAIDPSLVTYHLTLLVAVVSVLHRIAETVLIEEPHRHRPVHRSHSDYSLSDYERRVTKPVKRWVRFFYQK